MFKLRTNEATIQSEFYHWGRVLGVNVIPELVTPVGRLDLAVLSGDGRDLLAVVECKDEVSKLSADSEQIRRYKRLGVPVYGLAELGRCRGLLEQIARDCVAGKPLWRIMEMDRVGRPRRTDEERLAGYLARYNKKHSRCGGGVSRGELNIKRDRAW